jgi:hypothetical protein
MKLPAHELIALLLLLVLSDVTRAQNCQWRQEGTQGPGWYDSGGSACSSNSGQQKEPMVRQAKRWGAIATSDTTLNIGVVVGQESKQAASRIAMQRCGTPDCKIDITYHDQCAAVAWGTRYSAMSSASSIDEASEIAMGGCGKGAGDCKIVYSECSLPERIQ